MSYEKQNFKDGQVLKAEHLNKMEQGIEKANSIIVTEGTPDTLTWDGNTAGLVTDNLGVFCKISDATPSYDEVSSGFTVTCEVLGGTYETSLTDSGNGLLIEKQVSAIAIVHEVAVGVEMDGIIFPEAGTYVNLQLGATQMVVTIPGYTGFVTEKLHPKYLPDTVKLYYDSDKYLYATSDTSDTSKRLTKTELCSIMISAKKVLIAVENSSAVCYCTPTAYTAISTLAYATLYAFGGTDGTAMTFYTAEYTAS